MATAQIAPGLAERAAAAVTDRVRAYADEVAAEVRRNAPGGKGWLTSHDERVRKSHAAVDALQHDPNLPGEIPDNLRYQLPKMTYVRRVGWEITGGYDLAREPRDPNLPPEQKMQCRCESVTLPGAVARATRTGDVSIQGQRVTTDVTVTYPRIAESEHPDSGDSGGGWFRRSALDVAARHRR
jgi:hypothetical protein